jgi:hypothetical protein
MVCVRPSSRSVPYSPTSLNTRFSSAPVRSCSASSKASFSSLFWPRLSGTITTMTSSACGERISYSHALCVPSSRHTCLLPGIVFSCGASACPFVSTTCFPSRLPVPLRSAKVVLAACTSRPNYLSMGVLLRRYRCSQPEGFPRARRAPTIQQGGRLGGALPLRGVGPWAPVDGLHPQHRRDGHGSPRTHGATARAEALLLPPRSPARSLAKRRNGATCPAFERARGRHVPIMPIRRP